MYSVFSGVSFRVHTVYTLKAINLFGIRVAGHVREADVSFILAGTVRNRGIHSGTFCYVGISSYKG